MKNKLMITTVALAALVGFSASVQAIPIVGSLALGGGFTQNGADLTSSTALTITSTTIVNSTGNLAGPGAVSLIGGLFSPIGVNGGLGNLVGNNLWTLKVGTITYTFLVTSEGQGATSAGSLAMSGTATLSDGTLADNTAGSWQLNFGTTQGSFSWQNTGGANIPDGGTTAMLLGIALSGAALLKKKLTA